MVGIRILDIGKPKLLGIVVLFLLVVLIAFAAIPQRNVIISPQEHKVTIGKNVYNITLGKNISQGNVTKYIFELTRKADGTGKNFLILPKNTKIKTASELLNAIPNSNVVSFWNSTSQKWIGWISLRGGRGKNFEIKPNTVYEVSITKNVNWTLIVN
ncbi:hypothetical protein JYT91_00860 [archaeon AH-315-M20]|nr:hypothetical protein [archaeon AH-315-M20]